MEHYAGLDLSMETTQVCIVDETGRKIASMKGRERSRHDRPYIAPSWRRRTCDDRNRPYVAGNLPWAALGIPVVCIDARQAHQSLKALKANKTDPHDAAGPAQLARTGFYKEVHVTAHGVCSVITTRNHLVEARGVRLDNMILGLCATFGFKPGSGQGEAFIDRVMEAANVPGLGRQSVRLVPVERGAWMMPSRFRTFGRSS
ncbi:hypothetical protein [Shinella daejeonensis]|uniref:hypothetical protein n=1 Tax=Shinella daejeonensis TaxID=659017 RepID=UPI0020C7A2D5|nr:hypothetical protein [Shinella daejeonensis]